MERFLTDVDEVLADFQNPALDVIEQITGKRYKQDDFVVWDIFSVLTEEEFQACRVEFEKPGYCSALKPLPGAVDAIRESRKRRKVFAVTSPMHTRNWVFERTEWLGDLFKFTRKEIIYASTKAFIRGKDYLDDNPGHVTDWKAEHPDANAMLWHIPNTRTLGLDDLRVRSWEEVLSRLT